MTARSPRAGPSARQEGFTLLELLVALVLLSLVSLTLAGGIRFGTRAWEAGARRGADTLDMQLAQGAIRRFLGQAIPVALPEAELGRLRIAFEGRPDRVSFVASVPAEVGGGLKAFTIGVGNGGDLVLSRRAFDPQGPSFGGGNEERSVLLEGVSDASFAYFGPPRPDASPEWLPAWPVADALPRLVRISLDVPAGSVPWPDLFVATEVTAPPVLAAPVAGGS
jgi:general secretion pathway protein J